MNIEFSKILAAFGLCLAGLTGGALASPAEPPRQMLPSYVPATGEHGVASFRPNYRPGYSPGYRTGYSPGYRPRPLQRSPYPAWSGYPAPHPMAVAPVALPRPTTWPIPVSYRPLVPPPRMPRHGYPAPWARWSGYPPPPWGYGVRSNPGIASPYAYPYSGRTHYPTRAYRRPAWVPPPPVYPPPGYPSAARGLSRVPAWLPPPGMGVMPPRAALSERPWLRRPVRPAPAGTPQWTGRYRPYAGYPGPGRRPDYRFRPLPRPLAFQGQPVTRPYRPGGAVAGDYRFRRDPRFHPSRSYPPAGQRMPVAAHPLGPPPAGSDVTRRWVPRGSLARGDDGARQRPWQAY